MAISYGFYNSVNHDRVYNAEHFADIFNGVINDGVFMNIGDHFSVYPSSGMTVSVAPGRAWFNGTWTLNDANYLIEISESDVIQDRIDAVVLEIDKRNEARRNRIITVRGTPAATPQKPSFTQTGGLYQYPLAYVTVKAGTNVINVANIQQAVGMSECPFVTGILQTANLDSLYQAWTKQFNDWFYDIQTQMGDNVALNLQQQINQLKLDKVDKLDKATSSDLMNGTVDKWVDTSLLKTNSDSITSKIGDMKISANTLSSDWVPCDGRLLNVGVYPELFQKIKYLYGICGSSSAYPSSFKSNYYSSTSSTAWMTVPLNIASQTTNPNQTKFAAICQVYTGSDRVVEYDRNGSLNFIHTISSSSNISNLLYINDILYSGVVASTGYFTIYKHISTGAISLYSDSSAASFYNVGACVYNNIGYILYRNDNYVFYLVRIENDLVQKFTFTAGASARYLGIYLGAIDKYMYIYVNGLTDTNNIYRIELDSGTATTSTIPTKLTEMIRKFENVESSTGARYLAISHCYQAYDNRYVYYLFNSSNHIVKYWNDSYATYNINGSPIGMPRLSTIYSFAADDYDDPSLVADTTSLDSSNSAVISALYSSLQSASVNPVSPFSFSAMIRSSTFILGVRSSDAVRFGYMVSPATFQPAYFSGYFTYTLYIFKRDTDYFYVPSNSGRLLSPVYIKAKE